MNSPKPTNDDVPVQFVSLPKSRRNLTDSTAARTAVTVLSVPDLCCPTEASMVEKALAKLPGLIGLVPDYLRRQVRVEHSGLSEEDLLAAARTSGLAV